ncbi:hypothetical protein [Streptomyces goshikiensis]|uniref:hypothetical protein n=1 Tax=Streptomyces goshikiensis TaxID=1942 RepID=UPI0036C1CCC0
MQTTLAGASDRDQSRIAQVLGQLGPGVSAYVAQIADDLIEEFGPSGQTELIRRYAEPLAQLVMMGLLGMDERYAARVGQSAAAQLVGVNGRASARLDDALLELVQEKAKIPGGDLTSWLIHHGRSEPRRETARLARLLLLAGLERGTARISSALGARLIGPHRYQQAARPPLPSAVGALADLLAETAVKRIAAALPDLRLRVPTQELLWRSDVAPQCPESLPVVFKPVRFPLSGDPRWLPEPTFTTVPSAEGRSSEP